MIPAAQSGIGGVRDSELKDFAAECYYDPLKWVLGIYPWGKPGTFLAEEEGPDEWQCEVLIAIGQELLLVDTGRHITNAAQIAVGAAHGVGKTALEAWVIQFWLSTRRSPAMNCTAGTDTQLKTKLWRELNKWHAVSSNRDWFEWSATAFKMKENPLSVANAIPWSEHNAHAFAGLHEADPAVIFEESSVIADSIWSTQEGAFTTPGGLWLVVGNLTQASGAFYDCFIRNRKYWRCFNIDGRRTRKADKVRIAQWLDQYGEDSDFFRVRVKGEPPRGGGARMITPEMVDAAVEREILEEWLHDETAFIMGVDPGGGSNRTAIVLRKGPLVRDDWIIRFSEGNHMRTASLIASEISKWKPDYVFIDAHGLGKGIFDRLQQMGYFQTVACYGGDNSAVVDKLNYYNPRAEWWGRVAKWLTVSRVPADRDLRDELLRQPMHYDNKRRLQLMSKPDMMKMGLESPDTGDALSLTFAEIVSLRPSATSVAIEGGLPAFT